jgi:hypothetical protein
VLGNQTDFYKPPPLTEADMKFLRDLAALDKAHPLVRPHHEGLFQQLLAPSLFVERDRASLNNLPLTASRSMSCSTSTTPMRSKIGTLLL